MRDLSQKHILLIVTGGIAAVKATELVRLLQKAGASVQVILTENAKHFVSPLALTALTGFVARDTLWDTTQESEIGHIELSRAADLLVVAPATANIMAKLAHGQADDLASTCLLATDTEIMLAPAMNVRMWQARATQRNLATLKGDGVRIVGPEEGAMACGEYGPGRMAEPQAILDAITHHFSLEGGPLAGRHIVMTSGPTREAIDPVRYISNASSGKQGSAIAKALADLGARVTFVTGPAQAPMPQGCTIVPVTTAHEMLAAVEAALPADAAIFCAAVADWRVAEAADHKLKKGPEGAAPEIKLAPNPDLLATIAQKPADARPALVVGFAAETREVLENARAKRDKKGCDWLLANDVQGGALFGSDDNRIVLLTGQNEETWAPMSKRAVGETLAARIATFLSDSGP